MRLKLSEITTETHIPNGLQDLGDWYEGPKSWTLAEAFANLRKWRLADLAPKGKDEFEAWLSENSMNGLWMAEEGRTLFIPQVAALWFVARRNEIYADWMARDEVSNASLASRISKAKAKILRKY